MHADIIGPVSLVGRAKPTFALLANIYLWLPNVTDTTFGLDKPISYPAFNFTISNFTRSVPYITTLMSTGTKAMRIQQRGCIGHAGAII